MKILVITKQNSKDSENKIFVNGVEHLKKQGHNIKVDFDMMKSTSTADEMNKYQKKIEKAIREVDIVISEVSNADAKIGFDISKALAEKKIVIALHQENTKDLYSGIHTNKQKNLIVKSYNQNDIYEVVESAVEEAKGKMDTKFILIISPEIDRYLDWASTTKRMHKAQIVRNSVEKEMNKDKDYKNYTKA